MDVPRSLVSTLKQQQKVFFDEVKEAGEHQAPHVKRWPEPSPKHYYDVSVGFPSGYVSITANWQYRYVGVEFLAKNKQTYYSLKDNRAAIEGALGLTCDWQDLPERARSKILAKKAGDFLDEQQRADLRNWAVATADRFADVFPRYLKNQAATVEPPGSTSDRRRPPDTEKSPSLVKEYGDFRDEQEQDRRSTWDVTERPALEHFAALVPREIWSRSGSVFYSGRDAFGGPASAYLLGLNPGGDPNRGDGTTIRSDTEWVVNGAPANWSRYRDESWEGTTPGSWGMQPRVLHLLSRLSLDPGKVPASNLVFPRSRQEQGITDELRVLAEVCWPFHQAVIERLRVRAIICFGRTAAEYVRRKLDAHNEVGCFVEGNQRGWTSRTFEGPGKARVVQVTHPSRADWRNPASDPTELVRASLSSTSRDAGGGLIGS